MPFNRETNPNHIFKKINKEAVIFDPQSCPKELKMCFLEEWQVKLFERTIQTLKTYL